MWVLYKERLSVTFRVQKKTTVSLAHSCFPLLIFVSVNECFYSALIREGTALVIIFWAHLLSIALVTPSVVHDYIRFFSVLTFLCLLLYCWCSSSFSCFAFFMDEWNMKLFETWKMICEDAKRGLSDYLHIEPSLAAVLSNTTARWFHTSRAPHGLNPL